MTLREAWDRQAEEWARFVRTPDADRTNERFNVPRLLDLLPSPGRATLDLGCGDGRLGRELVRLGHRVVVVDAAALPFLDGSFDLVTAFMSLMDMDDMAGSVREAGRVLEPGRPFCFSITHPISTAGRFAEREAQAPFIVNGSYFEECRADETWEREGVKIEFAALHRPLEAYAVALEVAGFVIERLREHPFPRDAGRNEASA